jgi:hypothetical protein
VRETLGPVVQAQSAWGETGRNGAGSGIECLARRWRESWRVGLGGGEPVLVPEEQIERYGWGQKGGRLSAGTGGWAAIVWSAKSDDSERMYRRTVTPTAARIPVPTITDLYSTSRGTP